MIGTPRVHYREVGSTNVLARELARAGAPHGTLVTADHQSAGRGRSERVWEAPPGSSVLMSLVVRPADPLLPLRAAVALCDVAAGAVPSSGPTTCWSAAASWRASWWKAAPRRAGPFWGWA